jgi:hypothetical protein
MPAMAGLLCLHDAELAHRQLLSRAQRYPLVAKAYWLFLGPVVC